MEWISVKERKPLDDTPVIVSSVLPDGVPVVCFGFVRKGEWWRTGKKDKNVTRWMPLPEPPKD